MTNTGIINNYGTIDNISVIVSNIGTINDYCGEFIGTIPTLGNPVVDLCTPSLQTENLISDIEDEGLANKVGKSLLGPLKKVVKTLDDGNPDNDDAACDKLDEFIANVESKDTSGKLDSDLADTFIDSAEAIQGEIPC